MQKWNRELRVLVHITGYFLAKAILRLYFTLAMCHDDWWYYLACNTQGPSSVWYGAVLLALCCVFSPDGIVAGKFLETKGSSVLAMSGMKPQIHLTGAKETPCKEDQGWWRFFWSIANPSRNAASRSAKLCTKLGWTWWIVLAEKEKKEVCPYHAIAGGKREVTVGRSGKSDGSQVRPQPPSNPSGAITARSPKNMGRKGWIPSKMKWNTVFQLTWIFFFQFTKLSQN